MIPSLKLQWQYGHYAEQEHMRRASMHMQCLQCCPQLLPKYAGSRSWLTTLLVRGQVEGNAHFATPMQVVRVGETRPMLWNRVLSEPSDCDVPQRYPAGVFRQPAQLQLVRLLIGITVGCGG
jgi:hypothetical protein